MAKIRKRGKSYQIDYFDPHGKRIRKSFKKKKDAEAELGKRVSLIAEGRYLDVKKEYKTTLKDIIDKYTENYQQQKSFKTGKRHFIKTIQEYFGEDTLLSNIKYVDVETYRNHLKLKLTQHKTIRTDASVNREMSCLRHMLKKAVEWDMIEQSPFDRGKSLVLKENNKRFRFLSEEEIPLLLHECPAFLKNIVECALNTGMRKSEILTLKWNQVRNGFIYLKETKTNEARQIPINNDLEEMFDRIKMEPDGATVIAFPRVVKPKKKKQKKPTTNHIFNYNGAAVADVKGSFNNAVKEAGIVNFTFRDLRHTFASHFVMRGGTLKDLQEILGHTTMTMTLRYAHLTQEHKKKAVNLLNGLTAADKGSKNPVCHKTVTFPDQEKSASL